MKITATLLIYCDIDNTELSVVGVSSVHMMSTSEGEDQITDQQIQVPSPLCYRPLYYPSFFLI